jgi:hypothetical protein
VKEIHPPAIVQEAIEAESLFAEAQSGLSEFERLGRATAEQAIHVGMVLLRAKECCPHGKWMELMRKYFPGGKDRTARRAMLAAKKNRECTQRPSETLSTMVVVEIGQEEDEEEVSKLDSLSNLDTAPAPKPTLQPYPVPEEPAEEALTEIHPSVVIRPGYCECGRPYPASVTNEAEPPVGPPAEPKPTARRAKGKEEEKPIPPGQPWYYWKLCDPCRRRGLRRDCEGKCFSRFVESPKLS